MAISQHSHASMVLGATAVEEAHTTIVGLQSQLDSHHTDLIGNWRGQAQRAFSNVFTQFNEDFTNVIRSLEGILEKLRASGATYDQKEVEQVATASRVQGLLNGSAH